MRFFTEISRASVDGDVLRGYAAVYDQPTTRQQDFPGTETIARGAFDNVLAGEIVATVNHDFGKRLGSTVEGNVRLGTDETGLAFEIDLPNTDLAKTVRRMVDRGELGGMSFTATIGEMTKTPEGVIHRAFKALREISVVRTPAYAGTVVREAPQQSLREQMIRARHRVLMREEG